MKTQRGFTLIELTIVLVILMVLAGGLLMPLTARIETRRIAETQKTLEEARQAIIGYAMSHRVPSSCTCVYKADSTLNMPDDPLDPLDDPDSSCPVSLCPTSGTVTLTLPIDRHYLPCPDTDDDGLEDRLGSICAIPSPSPLVSGNLPWVTLGSGGQDSWGNRIRYSLTASYGDSAAGFSSTSTGNNQVCATSAGGCSIGTVAANVPVVLVSFGPNGWGARNVNGAMQTAPSSADELENTDADTGFVSRAPTRADNASGEFDDLVEWISHDLLTSRVCPTGGCP